MAAEKPLTTIWFKTIKGGKVRAYYWSGLQFRSFPISMKEAERRILDGEARLVERNPFDFTQAS